MDFVIRRKDRLIEPAVPFEVTGKHWLYNLDDFDSRQKVAYLQANDGRWELFPYGRSVLCNESGEAVESAMLDGNSAGRLCKNSQFCHSELDSESQTAGQEIAGQARNDDLRVFTQPAVFSLKLPSGESLDLLCSEPHGSSLRFQIAGLYKDADISIGRAEDCQLRYNYHYVSAHHALIRYRNERFYLYDTGSANGVYVNGKAIAKGSSFLLRPADRVWIMGLVVTVGFRFIAFNNPFGLVELSSGVAQVEYASEEPAFRDAPEEKEAEEAFYRSPRLMRTIEGKTFNIEDPPAKQKPDESPAILKIGPSLCMALGSAMMGMYMLSNLITGEGNPLRALPMLSMVLVMILGAVLWPNLSRRYERRKAEREERKRSHAYVAYLDRIREELLAETKLQAAILRENRISVEACLRRAAVEDRRLFERTPLHDDFMELRIGSGDIPLTAEVKFPQERITLERDDLKEMLKKLAAEPRVLRNVPHSLALAKDFVVGIVGPKEMRMAFMRGLVAQIAALHYPGEAKCVLLANEEDYPEWRFVFGLPHFTSNDREMTFVATDKAEASDLSLRLERELQSRLDGRDKALADFKPFYAVFVASRELALATEAVASLAELRKNYGFALLSVADDIRELPKECTRIIELSEDGSFHYNPGDATGNAVMFDCDVCLDCDKAQAFMNSIGAVPLETEEQQFALPKSLGFLELFEAGTVGQLNIEARWAQSDPMASLAVPLGMGPQGLPSMLDIHENAHGPHGLIAGTTGSGKSETIITMILAGAVSFRPDELSYVLIDYKGGGLAGAFDSPARRLPHLSGTITNLDGAAIHRSLVSIKSELKRRQALFNAARDAAGISTMDIYRYQAMYRQGQVAEPCSHLLIIADEFAELKTQQPEFIDELVSTARIGRSLGVHLILATQKPSGVVNDQISSNSRFRICLKVADAADSKEMLRRADAAEITDAGRYYMLVGYNEYFAMGQSAYAGTAYRPSEHYEPAADDALMLVTNTGRVLDVERPKRGGASGGPLPESVAVLDEVIRISGRLGVRAQSLWLEPVPRFIRLADLAAKYPNCSRGEEGLNPLVGEYDDPYTQTQGPLCIPLGSEGNAAVFGAQGSGRSLLLAAMLMSLIREYSASELNAYVLDFGSETLTAFAKAPQVGDCVVAAEEEKVGNLLRMLTGECERRRGLLSSFGGSLANYNQNNASGLPYLVVVVNNFDAFLELYPNAHDSFASLVRDGSRNGLHFVVSCTRAGTIPYRMASNFKSKLALSMGGRDEYMNILGQLKDCAVPKGKGRGLVMQGRILEFQAASVADSEEANEYGAIAAACEQMSAQALQGAPSMTASPDGIGAGAGAGAGAASAASAIPVLPAVVTRASYGRADELTGGQLFVGISKSTIEPVLHDFTRTRVMLAIGDDAEETVPFLRGILPAYDCLAPGTVLVLDAEGQLAGCKTAHGILTEPEAVNEAMALVIKGEGGFRHLLIVGLKSCMDALSSDVRKDFEAFVLGRQHLALDGIVVCEEPSRVSSFNFEQWYKELIGASCGVFVGSGVSSQSMLKLGKITQEHTGLLQEGFGHYVRKGRSILMKLVYIGQNEEAGDAR